MHWRAAVRLKDVENFPGRGGTQDRSGRMWKAEEMGWWPNVCAGRRQLQVMLCSLWASTTNATLSIRAAFSSRHGPTRPAFRPHLPELNPAARAPPRQFPRAPRSRRIAPKRTDGGERTGDRCKYDREI